MANKDMENIIAALTAMEEEIQAKVAEGVTAQLRGETKNPYRRFSARSRVNPKDPNSEYKANPQENPQHEAAWYAGWNLARANTVSLITSLAG